MRVASLAVGIADYEDPALRTNDALLKYPVSDARAFFDYARTAWPETQDESRHTLLCDREATLDGLTAAVADLRRQGNFDLFLIYLSGHGQHLESNASFCLADARFDKPSLDSAELDALLSGVATRQVLLVLDCCHAGAVLADAAFFTKLGESDARLFCTSARSEERAWEDVQLKRSVLSHVFLSLLSAQSSLADQAGTVDIESQLFPALRQQVPLMAAHLKNGAIQQPVTGGVGSSSIRLPTVAGAGFGRAPTLVEILRGNARRILFGIAAAVIMVLLVTDQLLYHLSVSATGEILVKPGVPLTYTALPVKLSTVVDSGFRVSQLERQKDAEIRAIAEGRVWGVFTHLDALGMRSWIAPISALLADEAPLEFIRGPDLLADGNLMNSPDLPVTRDKINLLSRLLGLAPLSFVRSHYGGQSFPAVSVSCGPLTSSTQTFDFDTPSTPSIGEGIRADLRYFARGAKDPSAEVWKLARSVSGRAMLRSYDSVAMDELRTFLAELSRSRKHLPLSSDIERTLLPYLTRRDADFCAPLAIGMLAILGSVEQRLKAERFFTRPAEPLANLVIGLRESGMGYFELHKVILPLVAAGPGLSDETLDALSGDFVSSTDDYLELIAEAQVLPARLYDVLFEQLASDEDEFKQLVAFRYLSRAYEKLPAARAIVLRDWAATEVGTKVRFSSFVVSLGLLGRRAPLAPSEVIALVAGLQPSARFDTELDPVLQGSVIEVNSDPSVVATAMISSHAEVPEDSLALVSSVLAQRKNLEYIEEAIASLTARALPEASDIAAATMKRLRRERHSASARRLTSRFAIVALNRLPEGQREEQLGELAKEWHQEPEPEIRAAIAQILASAD